MTGKFRIAAVGSHPIQYVAPLYAELNRDDLLEVTALYASDFSLRGGLDKGFGQKVTWDVDLLAGYPHKFMGEAAKTRDIHGYWSLVVPQLWREIRHGGYDAVWLHGYGYAMDTLALLAAKSAGVPVMMRSETHLGLTRTPWKQKLRDGVLRRWYRNVDRFLAVGSTNADYYRYLGARDADIFMVPYTVDVERFRSQSVLSAEERASIRAGFGFPAELPVALFASKFTPRKHPEAIIEAAALLRERGFEIGLLMVGTGEMETQLKSRVQALGLRHVVFTGFVNQGGLPKLYGASDAFVLPSENEPWGFIINEVMSAGLPVVVSKDIGSTPDLIDEGGNGHAIRAGHAGDIADALHDILSSPERAQRMGRRSQEIMAGWSYEQCRQGLRAAAESLIAERGR